MKKEKETATKKEKEVAPDRTVLGAERTLAILNAFIDASGPLGLTELEQHTGLFKSVIHRYMMSFIKAGYVVQRADSTYQLGPRAYQLGKAFEARFNYADFIVPALEKLVRETGESTAFYIRQQDQRLCMYAAESPESVKATVKAGSLFAIDQTSSAQVLRFFSVPGNAARSGGRYVCISVGINNPLSSSMSVPVFGPGNTLVGAMTIFGLSLRFDPAASEVLRGKLLVLAQELSVRLGATPQVYHNPSPDIFNEAAVQ
ncbi:MULTISPECIES: IclR family transcriptional regulator [unclassified Herbaspirillum]|uniref:IclR family transcriptional regulator n=1 Tax=unclassified Herbaspirillum TaxID=2624150 RepID=UPI00115130DC|nr:MULTISPECIES: helix-turn-helix domain-containing protein [unclassified Herbaspirillum]MBB5390915.1 DNA-binding IclR family transcriptional regulator [Herbaspirillum sp. SJZ102]TQK06439.1 IclR family transcriptional regulator [Herbaspirillum sp. SJZ130]TQK12083.1 IclR family transcriptional regulator [Herbaspirillum sp. SJZ106]